MDELHAQVPNVLPFCKRSCLTLGVVYFFLPWMRCPEIRFLPPLSTIFSTPWILHSLMLSQGSCSDWSVEIQVWKWSLGQPAQHEMKSGLHVAMGVSWL